MMDARRIRAELAALRKNGLGQFNIQATDDHDKVGAVGKIWTTNGGEYVFWIPLKYFPDAYPPIYIVEPNGLKNYRGKYLKDLGVVSNMHLNQPSDHGHPQICHQSARHWKPSYTVVRVIVKGLLWLEAYESHLKSGEPIDYYLGHMSS